MTLSAISAVQNVAWRPRPLEVFNVPRDVAPPIPLTPMQEVALELINVVGRVVEARNRQHFESLLPEVLEEASALLDRHDKLKASASSGGSSDVYYRSLRAVARAYGGESWVRAVRRAEVYERKIQRVMSRLSRRVAKTPEERDRIVIFHKLRALYRVSDLALQVAHIRGRKLRAPVGEVVRECIADTIPMMYQIVLEQDIEWRHEEAQSAEPVGTWPEGLDELFAQ